MLAGSQGAAATGQTATATRALGLAFTETKVKKDALDKNLDTMSSQGGSLWRTSFSLRILTSALGVLSFRALIEESKQLAETLVDTGMQLERATSFFNLMSEGSMTASEGIARATKTASDFGLATLPAIEGLGRMQASAYGTAAAGDAVNVAFQGMMAGLGAIAADAKLQTSALTALADSIGRVEISGRNIRQISRDFPGFKERIAEAFGSESVEKFMVTLDKGNLTMSQYLNAFGKAFSGTILEQAKANVNTLSGAVAGFHNAMLGLIQTMLDAGFKQDFIDGLKAVTEILTSPALVNATRQFAVMFGTVIKGALELFAGVLSVVVDHMNFFLGGMSAIVSGGVILSIVSAISLLNLAFAGLAATIVPLLGPIAAVAAAIGLGVGVWAAYTSATVDANKAIEAQRKAQDELTKAQEASAKAKPTEQMIRQAKDDEIVRERIEQLIQTTTTYRTELDLLDAGIRKDSISFTALAEAYKFINEQAAKGNNIDEVKRERILELTTAIASYNAQVMKRADNEKMLRDLQEQSTVTGSLITLAAGGANDSAIAMEQQFQDQFKRMKDRFEELIYMETNAANRQSLVNEFKQQAEALRGASLQAQLYANRLKAIQEINQGDRAMELEEQILDIWKSVNANVTTYTQRVTEATPSTIASFRPSMINPGSDAVNAALYQLDRANIGGQRQQINGNVEMTISGNITIANARGGVTMPGAGTSVTGGNYSDIINRASGKEGMDPKLIQAMIDVESSNKFDARSPKGAVGLMQLMPKTSVAMGVTNPYDPEDNIFGGTKYIKQQLDVFHGNVELALAAYNAGPDAVKKAGGVPNYPETQKYVTDVLEKFFAAGGQLPGAGQVNQAGMFAVPPWEGMKAGIERLLPGPGYRRSRYEPPASGTEYVGPLGLQGETYQRFLQPYTAERQGWSGLNRRSDLTLNIEKASDSTPQQFYAEQVRKIVEEQRQQELRGLYVEQQTLNSRGLVGGIEPGGMTLARRPRTRLEAARDEAGARAVSQFNQNTQLMGGIGPTESGEPLPGLEDIEKQRRRVELQARVGVDQRTIKDQIQYNFSLADQNKELQQAQALLATDAKYRDIDTQAANLQRKAIEEAVDPEQLNKTQNLIEANRKLQRSMVDMNGPFQQTIDSIGRFHERSQSLFIGALTSMGDAIATFTTTGKFDIKAFADAFIADLIRMEWELLIIKPLLQSLQGQGGFFENVMAGLGGAGASDAAASAAGAALTSVGAISLVASGGNVTLRGVEHFQGGGNVQSGTDTIPALLTPGEVVLTKAQQRNLAGASQGGNTYVFAPTVHAQDAESVRKTLPQIQAEFYCATERITKRNNVR